MTALVVDLFGGAGGFALGAHQHAPHAEVVSLEIDDDACATQDANDMRFKQTDLSDPAVADEWLSELNNVEAFHLHASPPCQTFSVAGKGEGRKHLDTLAEAVGVALAGGDPSSLLGQVPEGSRLTVAPATWIARLKPDTVSMEQVRTVLPLWEAYETGMQALGYQTWTGVLCAEQYGVPQARRRAWLMARRGYQPVSAPAPTHSKYHNRKPDCLDAGVLPWVSMAEALGWGGEAVGFPRRNDTTDGGAYRSRDLFSSDRPSGTVTEKARSWHWYVMQGRVSGEGKPRSDDQPAPTISAKGTASVTDDPDSHYGTERSKLNAAGESWEHLRPSTTVNCDPRLSGPGRNDPTVPGSQYGPKARRLTSEEAAILQGFPSGYVFTGSKTSQFRQIGNAVNPPVAAAVLRRLGW